MSASKLTLVDVDMDCLVYMPSNTTYIALSYVCGGPQLFQNLTSTQKALHIPYSISVDDKAIPQTIRDAIQLVRDLGERYLSVDALCICQDDMESKMREIMNMGTIYSQALMTIVAAAGSDANAGLPGVRACSRDSVQRIECVQGLTLVNELCHLKDAIEPSVWNTRCWTYQEEILSKRFIIFCKTHVFYQCNQVVYKEDSGVRNVAALGGGANKIRAEKRPIWDVYRRVVAAYTRRAISDESDAMNAFQGIASLLQTTFKGDFLCGLPGTELDKALLWRPAAPIHRRVDSETRTPLFPSWSWAGWIGEVGYPRTDDSLDDLSRVEWQCKDLENGSTHFYTSEELRVPKCYKHDRWQCRPRGRKEAYYYQTDAPDTWCLHPVAPKEKRQNLELVQPRSHHLVFRAYTAVFRILLASWNPIRAISDPLSEKGGISRHLFIIDTDGFIAGELFDPSHMAGTVKLPYQEFVCLSRRRENELDHEPAPEDDFQDISDQVSLYPCKDKEPRHAVSDHRRYNMRKRWPLYNVMMIAWDHGVAERKAIGMMHVTAFAQAKPVAKVITLA